MISIVFMKKSLFLTENSNLFRNKRKIIKNKLKKMTNNKNNIIKNISKR